MTTLRLNSSVNMSGSKGDGTERPLVFRYENNPLIKPENILPISECFQVVGVFNPGVVRCGEEIVLLLRVAMVAKSADSAHLNVPYYNAEKNKIEILTFNKNDPTVNFSDSRFIIDGTGKKYLTSLSCLLVARSRNGLDFEYDYENYILPYSKYHSYGIEDARIACVEGDFYINFSSASEYGIVTTMMKTSDFKTFEDKGVIMCPDNKDVSLFPEKIGGKYYALHRPSHSEFSKPDIWIASGKNIGEWGNHKLLMTVSESGWDSGRIGSSSIPFKTERGWIFLYHGATQDDVYSLGAVLLDLNDPTKVLMRTKRPFMLPETEYERTGFVNNVIFACGCLYNEKSRIITLYYGAADQYVCAASVGLDALFEYMEAID